MATPRRGKQPADLEPKQERQSRVDEGASWALAKPERMVLTDADREVFLDAVRNPPEPAERLVTALRRHCAVLG